MSDDVTITARSAWVVDHVYETGDAFYPYHVEGENLNYPTDSPGRRFSWTVPSLDGYDLSRVMLKGDGWSAIVGVHRY